MRRFDVDFDYQTDDTYEVENPTGPYVKFEDHRKEVARLQKKIAQLVEERDHVLARFTKYLG